MISDQKTAFARIYMFVRLGRITANRAKSPRPALPPFCPHRMGAVFDDRNVMGLTNRHQCVHIADVAAHMAQHQKAGLISLRFQIFQINDEILCNIHIDRFRPNGCNRSRHRRKGKRICQDFVAGLHSQRTQGRGKRVAPRGHSKTIFCTEFLGELHFEQGSFTHLSIRYVVAMKTTGAQYPHCRFDCLL